MDARRFRVSVRPLLEALVRSPGFAALPGPARVLVVDDVVSSMARPKPYSLSRGPDAWRKRPFITGARCTHRALSRAPPFRLPDA